MKSRMCIIGCGTTRPGSSIFSSPQSSMSISIGLSWYMRRPEASYSIFSLRPSLLSISLHIPSISLAPRAVSKHTARFRKSPPSKPHDSDSTTEDTALHGVPKASSSMACASERYFCLSPWLDPSERYTLRTPPIGAVTVRGPCRGPPGPRRRACSGPRPARTPAR